MKINQDYLLARKTIREARNMFMHVDIVPNLAKDMARLLLVLSRTVKLKIDLASIEVEEKNDLSYEETPIRILDQKGKDLQVRIRCDLGTKSF